MFYAFLSKNTEMFDFSKDSNLLSFVNITL